MIWSQVLVVLLSVILGLFLIVGIVLAVMVIRVTAEMKSITRETKRTIDNIEESVKTFNNTAKLITLAKGVIAFGKSKSRKNKEEPRDK